jgi:hypothetical protein
MFQKLNNKNGVDIQERDLETSAQFFEMSCNII